MSYIKFFPSFGVSAQKVNLSGAWRLWETCRSLTEMGDDSVFSDTTRELCTKYVSTRTFSRWIKQAEEIGLITIRTDGTRLVLVSQVKAAFILGVKHVESHRVEIKIKHLLGKNWRSYLWAAQEACITSGPISRIKLQQITGKDRGRQRRWENKAGVKRIKNIAQTKFPGDSATWLKEYTGRPYFKLLNKQSGRWEAWCRKPDIRTCKEIKVIGCGNSRSIRTALTKSGIISNYDSQGLIVPMFCDSDDRYNKTLQYIRKQSIHDREIPEVIYKRRHKNTYGGSRTWQEEIILMTKLYPF